MGIFDEKTILKHFFSRFSPIIIQWGRRPPAFSSRIWMKAQTPRGGYGWPAKSGVRSGFIFFKKNIDGREKWG